MATTTCMVLLALAMPASVIAADPSIPPLGDLDIDFRCNNYDVQFPDGSSYNELGCLEESDGAESPRNALFVSESKYLKFTASDPNLICSSGDMPLIESQAGIGIGEPFGSVPDPSAGYLCGTGEIDFFGVNPSEKLVVEVFDQGPLDGPTEVARSSIPVNGMWFTNVDGGQGHIDMSGNTDYAAPSASCGESGEIQLFLQGGDELLISFPGDGANLSCGSAEGILQVVFEQVFVIEGASVTMTAGSAIVAGFDQPDPGPYLIGGTVSGMLGSGLVLRNIGGETVTIDNNGSFAFETAVETGSDYSVDVQRIPSEPLQLCAVSNGSGVVDFADVEDIEVECTDFIQDVFGDGFEPEE